MLKTIKENWYALYTKPRFEKKVAESLSLSNIPNYCPLNKVVKQWHDRKKLVEEPLFTSYVFVKLSERDLWKAKTISGVINYVYWLGKPAVIQEKEIEAIKYFLETHVNVSVIKTAISINDKVKINSGLFINNEGQVLSIKGKQVQIQIPVLNITLVANLDTIEIQSVDNGNMKRS
jgi:transcription antitermination factor NusG